MDRSKLIALDRVIAGYTGPITGPVSFSLYPGETVGLCGPNGAGKSTLLRAIAGAARVFSGTIERGPGLRINHQQQRPERPPDLPLLGRELLTALNIRPDDWPPIVAQLLDRPIAHMSGGQFQLLQARACLGTNTTLAMFDEPTNNLDPDAVECLSAMLTHRPRSQAVLLVTHEQDFLEQHCDRVIELSHE